MPEATVHEDGDLVPCKNEIREVQPVSIAESVD